MSTNLELVQTNNLNDIRSGGVGGAGTCSPFLDETYIFTTPLDYTEVWVAKKGLTTYNEVITTGNGVVANDLYILDINGNNIAALRYDPTIGSTCGYTLTRNGAYPEYPINISTTMSLLKGQSVTFRVRGMDSWGGGWSITSGAVYFFAAPCVGPSCNLVVE